MSNLTKALDAVQTHTPEPPAAAPDPNTLLQAQTYLAYQQNVTAIQTKQYEIVNNTRARISKTIIENRMAKGWTQRELAAAAALSQSTVNRVERNCYVSMLYIIRIAAALDLKLNLTKV